MQRSKKYLTALSLMSALICIPAHSQDYSVRSGAWPLKPEGYSGQLSVRVYTGTGQLILGRHTSLAAYPPDTKFVIRYDFPLTNNKDINKGLTVDEANCTRLTEEAAKHSASIFSNDWWMERDKAVFYPEKPIPNLINTTGVSNEFRAWSTINSQTANGFCRISTALTGDTPGIVVAFEAYVVYRRRS